MTFDFYLTNQLLQSEFNSENFFLDIEFKQKTPKISLILHNFGPFNILEKKNLPLWFSLVLEKIKIGKTIFPKLLESNWLEKKLFDELDQESLQNIPRNYIELSYIIYRYTLNLSKTSKDQILVVEELFLTRMNKLTTGLIALKIPIRALKLENIGGIELINLRETIQIQLQLIVYTYSH